VTSFDPERIDPVIQAGRLRVSLLAVLSSLESAEFSFLRDATQATDGNVGAHLQKLEEAGYVRSAKRRIGLKRVTDYSLTAKGRKAFIAYLEHLAALAGKRLAEIAESPVDQSTLQASADRA
jgi:DNA-binding MarR family transcriptional regulator